MSESPVSFREELALASLVEAAFAPLATRTTTLSPARVRAALRWRRDAPPPTTLTRLIRTIARLP